MSWFVVRHAESEGQVNPTAYKSKGDKNLSITARGQHQAEDIGQFLGGLARDEALAGFDILHSTCARTTQTAEGIARGLGAPLVRAVAPDDRLDKQQFGLFNGLFTEAERRARTPDGFRAYAEQLTTQGPFFARPPGGESLADVDARAAQFAADRKNGFERNLIIVTHGTNALSLERHALRLPNAWLLERIDTMENCRVTRIDHSPARGMQSRIIYSPGASGAAARAAPGGR